MFLAVSFANSIVLLIAAGLLLKSWPILAQKPILHLLLSSSWSPLKGKFGFYPFIIGTVEVTAIAMILSVPVCLLSAIYLSEYAHRRFRELTRFVIDIMAAIPSVIYGLWGVLVVVPFVSVLGQILGAATTGYSLLAGGIILAIMVSPIIISVSMEVLSAVPLQARETALALARALAVEPEVVLADEPTSALDPISAQLIQKQFKVLKGNYTFVVVTHILRQARRIADYVIFLYMGGLVEHGPAQEVFNNPRDERTRAYISGEIS